MEQIHTVVIVSDFAHVEGGATSVAIMTALALADEGVEVYFFTAVAPVDSRLCRAHITVVCLEQQDILHNGSRLQAFRHGISNPIAARRFASLLNELDPSTTVIHIHTWTKAISSSIFSVARKLHFHVFITVHDYFLLCPNGGLYDYKNNAICLRKPMSLTCAFCNCDSRRYLHKIWRVMRQLVLNFRLYKCKNITLVFISAFSEHQIRRRKMIHRPVCFLQNPVDEFYLNQVEVKNNQMILYIGRLSEEKGIRLFCEAAKKASINAVIIGDGPLRKKLEKQYSKVVTFTGWLPHSKIESYLKKTRYLVFPSLWLETYGMSALETMMKGIPCVVSDTCAASEFINHKVNGLLFKSGSVDSLVNCIQSMKDDTLVDNLGNNAYEWAAQNQKDILAYRAHLLSVYHNFSNREEGNIV